MAGLDIKHVEPLIKEFSPPETLKKTFYQTPFGALMGKTYILAGMLTTYVIGGGLIFLYAPWQAFRDYLGVFWFGVYLATPLAFILLFEVLPQALRARRERRLKAIAIGGEPKPEYFRL